MHGLDPLIDDLARRHVPEEQVAAELELAWWRSALESLLEADRALLGANISVLDRLEADFRLVDEAHTAGSAQLLAHQLAETWRIGLVDWPDEADALKRALQRETIDSFDLQTRSAAPLARGRTGVARIALRGAGHRRHHAVRHRDPVGCRCHDHRGDRGRDPPGQAGRGVRRPGDPVAGAVHDRGRGRPAHAIRCHG